MPKLNISRSTTIQATADKVYGAIRDFRRWPEWSPWLVSEPQCKLEFAEDGKSYAWDGEIIGSGSMEILSEAPERFIEHRLTFLKPWKSVARVRFDLEPSDAAVKVTWQMDSSLPFFLFWMKKMMTAFVGMDYERGLAMLKDLAERGEVPSKLEFTGQAPFAGVTFVGRRSRCAIKDMGPHMKAEMDRVGGWLESSGATMAGPPLAIYHKWEPAEGTAELTVAAPIDKKPDSLPEGFLLGEIPAGPTYQVKHTGTYNHLGNAWSSGMMHARAKLFRQKKSVHPFEVYENDPSQVAPEALLTTVHFPAK